MKETSKRNISLIIVILIFGVALVVFFSLSWPNLTKVFDLNSQLNETKKEYTNQSQAVQLAKSVIEQYKNLNDVNQAVSLIMPKTDELYNVIVQLNKISESSGLSIQDLSLKEENSSATQKQQGLIKPAKILTLNITLLGNYESFKTWLEAIETNMRLMDIKSISFSGTTLSEKTTTSNFFTFKVSLDIYYQL